MTGCIKILDRTGHSVAEWNATDEASVAEAKAVFDLIMTQGMTCYALDAPGSTTGTLAKSFDPEVREYVAHRPLVGG